MAPRIGAVVVHDAHDAHDDRGPSRHDTPLLPSAPVVSGNVRATLTVMNGIEAGRIIAIDRPSMVVGRDPESDICVDEPAVSRRHARIGRGPGGGFYVEDLGSTNGTFVRGGQVDLAVLGSGDHVQLGPAFLMRFAIIDATDESLQRQLYEASVRDPLTNAFNRKYFANRLVAEVSHARRSGDCVALLVIDIDHFKVCNDAHGHVVGDRVLCSVVAQIMRTVRPDDVVARFGGDEFVVLSRVAEMVEARVLAERLRRGIERQKNPPTGRTPVDHREHRRCDGPRDEPGGRPDDDPRPRRPASLRREARRPKRRLRRGLTLSATVREHRGRLRCRLVSFGRRIDGIEKPARCGVAHGATKRLVVAALPRAKLVDAEEIT